MLRGRRTIRESEAVYIKNRGGRMNITETEIMEEDGVQCLTIKFKGNGMRRQTTRMPSQEWFDLIHIRDRYEELKEAHYFLMDELNRMRRGR